MPPPTPPTRCPAALSPVAQVFLLPTQGAGAATAGSASTQPSFPDADTQTGPQLAVVNLTGSFVSGHPSGLETETLTVLSICGTLRANLPRVTEVRFLVDGQPRATLAGHADLTRTYLAAEADPTTEGARP